MARCLVGKNPKTVVLLYITQSLGISLVSFPSLFYKYYIKELIACQEFFKFFLGIELIRFSCSPHLVNIV